MYALCVIVYDAERVSTLKRVFSYKSVQISTYVKKEIQHPTILILNILSRQHNPSPSLILTPPPNNPQPHQKINQPNFLSETPTELDEEPPRPTYDPTDDLPCVSFDDVVGV